MCVVCKECLEAKKQNVDVVNQAGLCFGLVCVNGFSIVPTGLGYDGPKMNRFAYFFGTTKLQRCTGCVSSNLKMMIVCGCRMCRHDAAHQEEQQWLNDGWNDFHVV